MSAPQAFDHTHYVPILKGKLGEFNALKQLYSQDRAALTPLIEVAPVDWDYDDDQAKKTEALHLEAVQDKMVKGWGVDRPFFVDLGAANLTTPVVGDALNRHPYTYFFDIARAKGLLAIPVVPLTPDPALLAAVVAIVARDNRGVMVRVARDDISSPTFYQALINAPLALGRPPAQIDLMVDLEDVDASTVAPYLMALPQILPQLPHLSAWRTFTLAGCGFPQSLAGFVVGSVASVPRVEWNLWTGLLGRLPQSVRAPAFSDYGVAFVDLPDIDPRFMSPLHNIRYTIANEWLIVRGQSVRKQRGPSNSQLCQLLMGLPEFCGPQFSEGDKHIVLCATAQTGPGNMTTWRQVGTNHHLTFVVRQLANRNVSSVPAVPGPVAGRGSGTP